MTAIPQGFSPAGRLFRLLQTGLNHNGSQTILEAWAAILGLDPKDKAAVFAGFGEVVRLIADARDHVRSHPEIKQDLYLRTLDQIEQVLLAPSVNGQWGSVVSGLNGPHILALEFCAEQLDRLSTEQELDPTILEALQKDLEGTMERLLSSDLPEDIKAHLTGRLEELRAAIVRYRLYGISALTRATEAAVGAVIVAQAQVKDERARTVLKDYLDIAQKALNVAAGAVKQWPMLEAGLQAVKVFLSKGS
jgi:hypothetical protein